MYYIDHVYGTSEKDSYESGCTGEYNNFSYDIKFESETIGGLIKELMDWFNVSKENIMINEFDNDIIDIVRMENKEGHKSSEHELERWKNGEIDLYYVNYSTIIHKREKVILDRTIEEYLNA